VKHDVIAAKSWVKIGSGAKEGDCMEAEPVRGGTASIPEPKNPSVPMVDVYQWSAPAMIPAIKPKVISQPRALISKSALSFILSAG
jgi:hypothetical protein